MRTTNKKLLLVKLEKLFCINIFDLIQLECPSGKYGQNCERQCKCLNGGKCDHVTGQCDCKVGFYGDTCLECPEGNYGKNCSMECNCQNGGVCNKVVGSCDCLKPGFHGDKCQHCMSLCVHLSFIIGKILRHFLDHKKDALLKSSKGPLIFYSTNILITRRRILKGSNFFTGKHFNYF